MATTANALLAFPNLADVDYYTPTFSGGAWSPSAPLTNLQQRFLAYKSRSLNCTTAATQFTIDLKTSRPIKVIVIPRHNLSIDATVTATITASSGNVVATQTQDVWPVVYPFGTLAFENPSWWNGKLTAENSRYYPMPVMIVLDEQAVGRYVKLAFSDTANAAGYVELSRLFIAPGWQPTTYMDMGARVGVTDSTIVTTSLGGADFFDVREKRRTAAVNFPYLPRDEAFANALDMQVRLGLAGQFFFSYDPTDLSNLHRHSFLATLTALDPLTASAYGFQGASFAIKEVVA